MWRQFQYLLGLGLLRYRWRQGTAGNRGEGPLGCGGLGPLGGGGLGSLGCWWWLWLRSGWRGNRGCGPGWRDEGSLRGEVAERGIVVRLAVMKGGHLCFQKKNNKKQSTKIYVRIHVLAVFQITLHHGQSLMPNSPRVAPRSLQQQKWRSFSHI